MIVANAKGARSGTGDRSGGGSMQNARLATLHTGALHKSTLPYATRAVCAAKALARSWTPNVVSVVVYWKRGPLLTGTCSKFDSAIFLSWNASRVPGLLDPDHRLRNAWTALSVAVDSAIGLGARWLLRVRFDAYVAEYAVEPMVHWTPHCVYAFRQSFGYPSDNVLLLPTHFGRMLFNPARPAPLAEHAVVAAAAGALLDLCWIRADVWLFKPDRVAMPNATGSRGIRHWSSPAHPLRVAQTAVEYDPSANADDRALHESWPLYTQAPFWVKQLDW